MATTRNSNPAGKLELINYFHESASSHHDKSRSVFLEPGEGTQIKMIESSDSCNQYSGPRTEKSESWVIEREELIALIKERARRM